MSASTRRRRGALGRGVLVALLLAFTLLLRWLGAHEVMVPTMIGGMTANMTVCVAAHYLPAVDALDGAWLGALIGLGVLAATYAANAWLAGEA